MEEGSTGKRENPDQIPRDDDAQSETGRVVSEQAGVQGQRKEVNVESYSKVAEIGQILKDMDFPADKNKIISFEPFILTINNRLVIFSIYQLPSQSFNPPKFLFSL